MKKINIPNFFAISKSIKLVQKYISKIQQSIGQRNRKNLNPLICSIINDISFNLTYFKKMTEKNKILKKSSTNFLVKNNNKFKKIKFILSKILLCLKKYDVVFAPSQKKRFIWDFLNMFLILILFFVISFDIGFQTNLINPIFLRLSLIIYFFIDILVKFNTAVFEKGALTYSRRKIFFKYISSPYFIFDLLGTYPFFHSQLRGFADCIFFFKFIHFKKMIKNTEQYLFIDEKLYNYINLIKLILSIILIAHIFACVWHLVGISSNNDGANWIEKYNLNGESHFKKYLYAFYFVIVTMNTVGYGSIIYSFTFNIIIVNLKIIF